MFYALVYSWAKGSYNWYVMDNQVEPQQRFELLLDSELVIAKCEESGMYKTVKCRQSCKDLYAESIRDLVEFLNTNYGCNYPNMVATKASVEEFKNEFKN